MKILQLNHVALHVANLEASEKFYGELLGLPRMPRPAFNFPGTWYRIGVDQELHLIAREPEVLSIPRERHFAMAIDDATAWKTRLQQAGVEFQGPKPRPDGALQIFLRDPDGHVVELCTLVES